MPDLKPGALMNLLNISRGLALDGEITPVMAFMMVLKSNRVHEMTAQDFEVVKNDLAGKARCYGYVSKLSWAEDIE